MWRFELSLQNNKKKFNQFFSCKIYFTDCKCNERGSVGKTCDNNTGICACKPHIVGAKCDQCDEGYYGWSWPDCGGK